MSPEIPRASSGSHIPAASPVGATGLNMGQENTEHAFCHPLAAPATSARLQRLEGRPQPACTVGRGRGGTASSPRPCTHPGTSQDAPSVAPPSQTSTHRPPQRATAAGQTDVEGLQPVQWYAPTSSWSDQTGSDPGPWTLWLPGWGLGAN